MRRGVFFVIIVIYKNEKLKSYLPLKLQKLLFLTFPYTVERVFFAPVIFPRFSENEVFAQCYFHDFRFICSLSLVIIHFRAVLFSRFFQKREKRENITGAKKKRFTVYCTCRTGIFRKGEILANLGFRKSRIFGIRRCRSILIKVNSAERLTHRFSVLAPNFRSRCVYKIVLSLRQRKHVMVLLVDRNALLYDFPLVIACAVAP